MKLNRIIFGDNSEVLQTFPDECIDLVVTSPPYGQIRSYDGFDFNFEVLVKELKRVLKDGGVIVWVVGDDTIKGSESLTSFRQAITFQENGFKVHDTMIYEKSGFANPSNNRYHQIFEYMFIFVKGKLKTFNPIKDKPNKTQYDFGKGRRKKDGSLSHKNDKSRIKIEPFGMRFNIWRYATGKGNSTRDEIAYKHPAIFPEKLAQDHILSWSNEGDVVLDPFTGSGTTLKMAHLNNRKYIGIELNPKYAEIIQKRMQIAQGIINKNKQISKLTNFF